MQLPVPPHGDHSGDDSCCAAVLQVSLQSFICEHMGISLASNPVIVMIQYCSVNVASNVVKQDPTGFTLSPQTPSIHCLFLLPPALLGA